MPLDPVGNQPLRYRLTKAGRYQLWSVAGDRRDDGGVVSLDPDATIDDLETPTSPRFQGDWVWSYEPLVKPADPEP